MKVNHIHKVNEAICTLRNFIDLSAQLLPYLIELKHNNRDPEEEKDLKEISNIFENYSIDNRISLLLMNTSIIETIEKCYLFIIKENHSETEEKKQLHAFRIEHRRLKKNWKFIDSN
jgi:hypothetical protein